MREGDAILIADMCHNDTAMSADVRYITYNANDLPHDAGITVSDSGRSFKASLYSSGNILVLFVSND